MAKSGKKTWFDAGKIGFCHCTVGFETQVQKLCTDLDLGLLYILILGTYSKSGKYFPSARCLLSTALLEHWPQVCRAKINVYKTTDESFRFHNKNFDEMRCKLDSTENPRSFEKYSTPS